MLSALESKFSSPFCYVFCLSLCHSVFFLYICSQLGKSLVSFTSSALSRVAAFYGAAIIVRKPVLRLD